MKRRNFLIGVGAVAPIAGCVSDTGEDEQPDQSPDEETTEEETAKDETVDEETATDEETAEEETATEETAEEEPIYQEEQEEELILPLDEFPEGWERDDEANPDFDAIYLGEDQSEAILISVGIGETVRDAREAFEDLRNRYRDPQEIDIGDQAFWDTQDSQASTVFRHSNAVAELRATREVGVDIEPAVTLSQNYATEMFDYWQGL